jgi:hypothetical protein
MIILIGGRPGGPARRKGIEASKLRQIRRVKKIFKKNIKNLSSD